MPPLSRVPVLYVLYLTCSCAAANPPATNGTAPAATVASSTSPATAAPLATESAPTSAANNSGCEPEISPPAAAQGPFAFEGADGLQGYKNADGSVAINPKFQMAFPFREEGLGSAVLNNSFVFIDRSGQILANAFAYDNGPDYFVEGLARIVRDGKMGFINPRGGIAIEPRFDFAGSFCEGRAAVCSGCKPVAHGEHTAYEGGRWGFIDKQGQLVIGFNYDQASRFDGGAAPVESNGRRFQVDLNGQELTP